MENEKDELQSMREEMESMRAELEKMKKEQAENTKSADEPTNETPVEQAPVQQAPVQQAPVQQAPVQQAPPVQPVKGKKTKKKKKGLKIVLIILAVIFVLILLVSCLGGDNEYSEEPNGNTWDDDYDDSGSSSDDVVIDNNVATAADEAVDADSFTLMVYVCGSDLESQGGAATSDLTEMMYAETGENLKIVVQTGGASEWQNDIVSAETVERYLLNSEGMTLLEDVGNTPVTDPDLVADFINFSVENYPADRYGFIFWNHGGGTISGYGVDENFDSQGMDITQIAEAFEKANHKFDFIGFDCCLMATVEIAKAISPYADYMIASEETEPGAGWYYTDFMTRIEQEPGIPMKELGKQIIDDFLAGKGGYKDDGMTLSLIDLSQMDYVVDTLNGYLGNSENVLLDNGFAEFSQARSNARAYGDNEFEQIDIIDYANRTNVEGKDELIAAVQSAVLYSSAGLSGSNGLAMYYPYVYDEYYGQIKDVTDAVGFTDTNYNNFFNDFVSIKQGGRTSGKRSQNPFAKEDAKEEEPTVTNEDWYNADAVQNYEYTEVNSDELEITEKGDGYVLSLSDEEWDKITDVEIQVYLDDGEGYLKLGSDDLYEFDDDGDLLIDYDATWIYLDDSIISYYAFEKGEKDDGTAYSLGYANAVLNDEKDIKVWIIWEGNDEQNGKVLGYTLDENSGVGSMANKGYTQFKEGDIIDFAFDYYDYDGNYSDSYTLEDNVIKYSKETKFELAYGELENNDYQICFYLKDIYQNEFWTEALDISFEE